MASSSGGHAWDWWQRKNNDLQGDVQLFSLKLPWEGLPCGAWEDEPDRTAEEGAERVDGGR